MAAFILSLPFDGCCSGGYGRCGGSGSGGGNCGRSINKSSKHENVYHGNFVHSLSVSCDCGGIDGVGSFI